MVRGFRASARWRMRATLAAAASMLVSAPSALAATTVTGDRDTNAPLVIDPSTNPTDAFTKQTSMASETVLFIQRMPVTKTINKVTLGDFGLAAGCATGTISSQIWEHAGGGWSGSTNTRFYSTSSVPLPATPSKVSWSYPASTLLKGRAYSFRVTVSGCPAMKRTTWQHNSGQVDGGPLTCEQGPSDKRMWHVTGVDDAPWSCVTRTEPSRTFKPTMPGGWLVSYQPATNIDIMAGSYLNDVGSPGPSACSTSAAANPQTLGASWFFWRPRPDLPNTHSDFVCKWGQFGPPNVQLKDGWYYALPWLTERGGSPRDIYVKLETIDYSSLLNAHSPILVFDSSDLLRSVSPGASTDFFDASDDPDDPLDANRLVDSTGAFASANQTVASQQGIDILSLDYLGATYGGTSRRGGGSASSEDFISERGDGDHQAYLSDAAYMQSLPAYADRIFGRVTHDSEGRIWLQYWIYYYVDPQENFLGSGLHEGDWETVQVRLNASLAPEKAAYAQHGLGETCDWPYVENSGGHPAVYVAQDSHASYFRDGVYQDPNPDDDADAGGGVLVPVLIEIGAEKDSWLNWPGRWGDSSSSPSGPQFQGGGKWSDPKDWADKLTSCGGVN